MGNVQQIASGRNWKKLGRGEQKACQIQIQGADSTSQCHINQPWPSHFKNQRYHGYHGIIHPLISCPVASKSLESIHDLAGFIAFSAFVGKTLQPMKPRFRLALEILPVSPPPSNPLHSLGLRTRYVSSWHRASW